ncbi:MAG TPA: hypothetical protein DCQ50_01620 [Chryseobacterium sp.]|nr:hypothetical protein [Chryseobacterium sp.]
MKHIYFNVQSKGGAGKSMLTYLQALKHEENTKTAFIDLDSATCTSLQQLKFIGVQENRLFKVDILDFHKKIEREKLFTVIEKACAMPFEKYFIDFGAAESEQLARLLSLDFTSAEFKEFEKEQNARFVFNVVIAGGTSYVACFEYLKNLLELVGSNFEMRVYANDFMFKGQQFLLEELKRFIASTKGLIKSVIQFGNFFPERVSGTQIIETMKMGKGKEGLSSFSTKIIIRKELAKI